MCLRHNLCRQVQPFTEIRQSFVGQGVVIPLPGELGLDESFRGEGLHRFDHFQVSDGGDVGVSGAVEVFRGD